MKMIILRILVAISSLAHSEPCSAIIGPTDSVVKKGKGKPVLITVSTKMYCSIGLSSLPPNSFFQLKPIHPSEPMVFIAFLNSLRGILYNLHLSLNYEPQKIRFEMLDKSRRKYHYQSQIQNQKLQQYHI